MKRILLAPLTFLIFIIQSVLLALGQIWANKARSILTTIGIIIGVASVTAVIAALTGLKAEVLSSVESFGTNRLYINSQQPDKGPMSNASGWSMRFLPEQFDGLLEHCPSVEQFGMASWGGNHTVRYGNRAVENVTVFGIDPSYHRVENRLTAQGRMFSVIDDMQRRQICQITPDLKEELRLDQNCIGQSITINNRAFRIVGVMEPSPPMPFQNDNSRKNFEAYIPFNTNLKLTSTNIWAIASSKSTEVTEDAEAEIRFFLRRTRNIKPGEPDTFRVFSLESEIKKFNKVAFMITAVASGVVGISLLVGGIGIMNIMLVSVSERTREIGLRKAVGARPIAIMLQFLVEAIMLCLFGGLLGVGFGQLLTALLAKIPNAHLDKAYIPVWAIAVSFGFSALVGVFFGMFPAIKAARLDPIEALRHE
jgi:putative ABC transport system permease protein